MGTEFGLWANELSFIGGLILLVGSVVGVSGMFMNWQFSVVCIPVSIVIIIIEFPPAKVKRRSQHKLARALMYLGPLVNYYWPRGVIYSLISVPSFFLVPTFIGGLSVEISAIIYLVAHIRGEKWEPLPKEKENQTIKWLEEPKIPNLPPPRADTF